MTQHTHCNVLTMTVTHGDTVDRVTATPDCVTYVLLALVLPRNAHHRGPPGTLPLAIRQHRAALGIACASRDGQCSRDSHMTKLPRSPPLLTHLAR